MLGNSTELLRYDNMYSDERTLVEKDEGWTNEVIIIIINNGM